MNKRIKKKVTKRVLIKLKSKQSLSKFETKFFKKNILPTFIEIFIAFRKALEEALPAMIEIATEKVNELSDEMEEADQENNEEVQDFPFNEFINVPLNEFIDNAEGSDMASAISLGEKTPNQARESMGIVGIDAEGFDNLYKSTKKVDNTSIIDTTGYVEDDLQLNTDSIDKLDKSILGTKERITTGVLNAETIFVSNNHLVTPESQREIETTVKGLTYSSTAFSTEDQLKSAVNSIVKEPSKWNKLKGKLKGWFGK